MLTLKTQAVGCSKTQSVILYIHVILLSAVIFNLSHILNTTHKHNEAQAHMGMTAPKPHLFHYFLWEYHF